MNFLALEPEVTQLTPEQVAEIRKPLRDMMAKHLEDKINPVEVILPTPTS